MNKKKEIKTFEIHLWIKDKESEEIIFKKDGKNYPIWMVGELRKFLLRYEIPFYRLFVPVSSSYEIYKGYMGEPNNSSEKDRERQEIVKLVNEWNWGRIAIFLIVIIVIVALILWMFKKKKKIK